AASSSTARAMACSPRHPDTRTYEQEPDCVQCPSDALCCRCMRRNDVPNSNLAVARARGCGRHGSAMGNRTVRCGNRPKASLRNAGCKVGRQRCKPDIDLTAADEVKTGIFEEYFGIAGLGKSTFSQLTTAGMG